MNDNGGCFRKKHYFINVYVFPLQNISTFFAFFSKETICLFLLAIVVDLNSIDIYIRLCVSRLHRILDILMYGIVHITPIVTRIV